MQPDYTTEILAKVFDGASYFSFSSASSLCQPKFQIYDALTSTLYTGDWLQIDASTGSLFAKPNREDKQTIKLKLTYGLLTEFSNSFDVEMSQFNSLIA